MELDLEPGRVARDLVTGAVWSLRRDTARV
jgi:hypothetical protein